MNIITGLKSEYYKFKRSGFYWLILVFAIIAPLILTIVQLSQNDNFRSPNEFPYNWYISFIDNALEVFKNLFFPIFLIVSALKITQLDHKNSGWEYMELQPLKKSTIFFSKFILLLLSNFLVGLLFLIFSYLFSWITQFFLEIHENAIFDLELFESLRYLLILFIASIPITSVMYVVGVKIKGYIWPIVIGFTLFISLQILSSFGFPVWWNPFHSLNGLGNVELSSDFGIWITNNIQILLLLSGLVLIFGYFWYSYKKIKFTLFKNNKRALLILVLFILGSFSIYTLLQPKQMEPHVRTVISGSIVSDKNFNSLLIIEPFFKDTIVIDKISKNKFESVIHNKILDGQYMLFFDDLLITQSLYFGNLDSLHVNFEYKNKKGNLKFGGTSFVENKILKSENQWGGFSSLSYYINSNITEDSKKMQERFINKWKHELKQLTNYKSIDNYIVQEKFVQQKKKLLALDFYKYWNKYKERMSEIHPDIKVQENEKIKEILNLIQPNDVSLFLEKQYFDFQSEQLIKEDNRELDVPIKTLQAIEKLENSEFKDRMLFGFLNRFYQSESDDFKRDSIQKIYSSQIQNSHILELEKNNLINIKRTSIGKPMIPFLAFDKNNKSYGIEDFKGSYVVIDFWATWCGPCTYEKPYFEKYARKFKNKNIQFLAISSDQDYKAWDKSLEKASSHVKQLILKDGKYLASAGITGIPRFVLIDPDGNYLYSNFTRPSNQLFEKLINDYLEEK